MLKLYHTRIDSTWYAVVLDGARVVATNFSNSEQNVMQPLLKSLPYHAPFETVDKPDVKAEEVFKAMSGMLEGKDVSFRFEFDMTRLPHTTRRLLEVMSLIPTGYVTTYGALAKAVGTGPRVAGHACATNPFAPMVPCHRVVASDLSLGGYGGGLQLKWKILQKENRGFKEPSNVKLEKKELLLLPISQLKRPR